MIQMTYARMNRIIPSENIFVVTNSRYVDLVKEQLPDIKDINIITEPCSKNTAPCILLSTLYIKNLHGEDNIVCVSSDSYIGNEDKFLENIKLANEFVNQEKEAIVTLGITPTRPETGYGYIKYEKGNKVPNKVIKFVEKPDIELAIKYLDSKEYLWNAGMFIFNSNSMLHELDINLHNEYDLLKD
jgi:mannose-1-phosphate guanylyltransferase